MRKKLTAGFLGCILAFSSFSISAMAEEETVISGSEEAIISESSIQDEAERGDEAEQADEAATVEDAQDAQAQQHETVKAEVISGSEEEDIEAAPEEDEPDMVLEAEASPDVHVSEQDIDKGTARLEISDVKLSASSNTLTVPVWSRGDQSDIVWYTASKDSSGRYYVDVDISKHKYHYAEYIVHVYEKNTSGAANYICGTKMEFSVKQGTVSAERLGAGEHFKLTAKDFTPVKNLKSISAAVWSNENGQDDLTWTACSYDEDEIRTECLFETSKLKHAGDISLHFYAEQKDGTKIFIGGQVFRYSGNTCKSVDIKDKNDQKGTCRIVLTGVKAPAGVKEINVAAWTRPDQSDVCWYKAEKQSDGSYAVDMDIANHKNSTGEYSIHAYLLDKSDVYEFIGSTTVSFDKAEGDISVVKSGAYWKVTAKNVVSTFGIKGVHAAVWTDENGQDDLTWTDGEYDAGTNTVTAEISEMKLRHTGTAQVHIYITGNDGNKHFLTGTTFEAASYTAKMAVMPDNASGTFSITINGKAVPSNTKTLRVGVWSASNQSDMVWYNAQRRSDGNYEVKSSIAKHKNNIGTYNVHVYAADPSGKTDFFDGQVMKFEVKNSGLELSTADGRNYTVKVSSLSVPGGADKVQIAAWSDKGGQDDLVWYDASGTNGGDYKGTVDIARHKTEGRYTIHVYVKTKGGQMICAAGSTDLNVQAKADASLSVPGANGTSGTFDTVIKVSNASCALSSVSVAVWSTSDQSDLKWYKASNAGSGKWTIAVDVRNHKNNFGTYHMHAYGMFENGIEKFLNACDYAFDPEAALIISGANGSYSRRLTFHNRAVKTVRFAVWSQTGGQDDVVWYDGKKTGDGTYYADAALKNHRHNGTFIVHVYTDQGFAAGDTFSMIDYVEYAINIANNDAVGYSQVRRELNPDVDCSSLVFYALINSGFGGTLGSSPFYTGSQVVLMSRCGFQVIPYTGMDALQPGDVLWFRHGFHGHTEIYIGNGYTVGAHDSVVDGVDYPQGGDQTGREVSVAAFYPHDWDYVLRIYS